MTAKRFNSYCDNENIRIRIDDDIKNKEVFHIYFAELDDALYCKSKLNSILDLLNELHEENIVLKKEVELLRNGLEAYEDNLPVYLTCKEVRDFHSDVYDFKKKEQSFYNKHPNRCKISVNGVELK